MTFNQLQDIDYAMTYWVIARDDDGKTFIGTIAGMEGRRIHHWLQIDASLPHKITIEGIPVIVFSLFTDGPVATQPFWGRARLKLNKHWRHYGRTGVRQCYVRSIRLYVTHGNSLWVHSWGTNGMPNLINSPGDNIFPISHRRCLDATLMQVGMMRHMYSTARHIRMENPDIPPTDERIEEPEKEEEPDSTTKIKKKEATDETEKREVAESINEDEGTEDKTLVEEETEPRALRNFEAVERRERGNEPPHKSRNLPG